MRTLFVLLSLFSIAEAQFPAAPSHLNLLGTRTWIRVQWKDNAANEDGFKIYWSQVNEKPAAPNAVVEANKTRYYVQQVNAETNYYVWVEAYNALGSGKAITGAVTTVKSWTPEQDEINTLDVPSSEAVPAGMQLYWHDEFNDELLNRNKWCTNYYSNMDYLIKENWDDLKNNNLPEAAYTLNGKYIDIFTNDSLPLRPFSGKRKISSIQTYSWSTNENLLDNSRGGYFEARVRRGSKGKVKSVNTAFWFDSPGPDLKYYLQEGSSVDGVKGIRPKGQLFEIDMFENLDAQFVMHGHVDSNGKFIHNLNTDIAKDYTPEKYEPGKEWVTFGLLWTPDAIKHYINGKLVKAYDNKDQIYSPNHFMNVFLGSYGEGGAVNMEVDYIRYYRWPIENGNELPNGGAEAGKYIAPWEGDGSIATAAKRSGNNGFLLAPGQSITQYVYLNNSKDYTLRFWARGGGKLNVEINNIKLVTGERQDASKSSFSFSSRFSKKMISFTTGSEYQDNMKTVRVSFSNAGTSPVMLDDIAICPVR